jgi:hypothetical protein
MCGYKMPLCQECRVKHARKPIPAAIKGAGLVVVLMLVVALVRIPSSVAGAVALERGKKYDKQRNYENAATEYQKVVDAFPDSTLAIARLGIVEYRLGELSKAERTLNRLAGRTTDSGLVLEVNSVIDEMERGSR